MPTRSAKRIIFVVVALSFLVCTLVPLFASVGCDPDNPTPGEYKDGEVQPLYLLPIGKAAIYRVCVDGMAIAVTTQYSNGRVPYMLQLLDANGKPMRCGERVGR